MSKYHNLSKEELLRLIEKQEQELKNKKYGLVWDNEREPEQVVLDCENYLPVLKRVKSKEIKTDDSEDNILIEGDNYHALTVLNYTHKGKIDVIYIDPPYNTGKANEWKYNDKYVDKNDSYRHSKWLNFMEKRLKLAKELLKEDGVIFISIDDHEVYQLKLLMDKIFGEENFVENFIWVKNFAPKNDSKYFSTSHEYIITVSKNKNLFKPNRLDRTSNQNKNYSNPDNDPRGVWSSGTMLATTFNKKYVFPILKPNGEKVFPPKGRCWRYSESKIKELIQDNRVWFGHKGNNTPRIKRFLSEVKQGIVPTSLLNWTDVGSTQDATNELRKIFNKQAFDFPKPIKLIKYLIKIATLNKNAIVLDFFAGSGTTGHAVLELNKEDGGSRKFILVTNNEGNIATEVCYPRIKKIIKGYEFKGKDKQVLYEKKLTFTQLKKIDEILEEINQIIEENKANFDKIEKEFKENTIKIIGVKDIDGFKKGLGDNLQYFKTSLIKKSKNRDQVKIDLTQKATEMLCVKENIYNLEKEGKDYKIFSSNKKDCFLCIYYNFIDDSFDEFLEELKKLNGKKIIYMFAIDNKVDKSLFSELDDFTIEPIPQKILDVYNQLVKMNIPIKVETIFIDLEKAKKQIFDNEDKDTGAKILRVVLEKLLQKIAQLNQINILNDKGKEIKISNLNDILKAQNVLSQVEWQENQTYLAIGNHASHGEYDEYNLEQVKNFYKHIQSLIDKFNI